MSPSNCIFAAALLLCSTFACVAGDSECPLGWTFDASTTDCYLLTTELYSFDEAKQFCESVGGQMAYIDFTTKRDDYVVLTNGSFLQPWMGTRRNLTTGKFYNINGAYLSLSVWLKNEPSADGDCATLRGLQPAGLKATPCYKLQPAFCYQSPALCNGGNFGGLSVRKGSIKSPGFPVQYYNNLNCNYLITSPNNTYITISFDVFKIEEWYDSLTIFDGDSKNYSNYIGTVSSYNKESFETTSNKAFLVFKTDYRYTDIGWSLNWEAKTISTPITQTGSNGTMTSPNYPMNYDPYTEQIYNINVAYGFNINMTIDTFKTEQVHDYLAIYDGRIRNNQTLVAKLSGMQVAPWSFRSSGSAISMVFVSDGSLQYKGWQLTWTIC
ncbi:unnamed protein product [Caenorhabditis bovis]|uniref:CUB domain-containing protein n=1 Tax=Caenorhabditis bovis TaxID=2654633 RepID=A0A8S1E0S8_9PELO|nr:unnamed protein product [Caenorhabditis bovis]